MKFTIKTLIWSGRGRKWWCAAILIVDGRADSLYERRALSSERAKARAVAAAARRRREIEAGAELKSMPPAGLLAQAFARMVQRSP